MISGFGCWCRVDSGLGLLVLGRFWALTVGVGLASGLVFGVGSILGFVIGFRI